MKTSRSDIAHHWKHMKPKLKYGGDSICSSVNFNKTEMMFLLSWMNNKLFQMQVNFDKKGI